MKLLARIMRFLGLVSATTADDDALREDDRWFYHTRKGEQGSFLVIRKIERLPGKGEVAHISVFRLQIESPRSPGGYADHIGHLPISTMALRESLTTKSQDTPPEFDWRDGYDSWSDAKGGVFMEPVSKCVDFVEEALTRGHVEKA